MLLGVGSFLFWLVVLVGGLGTFVAVYLLFRARVQYCVPTQAHTHFYELSMLTHSSSSDIPADVRKSLLQKSLKKK